MKAKVTKTDKYLIVMMIAAALVGLLMTFGYGEHFDFYLNRENVLQNVALLIFRVTQKFKLPISDINQEIMNYGFILENPNRDHGMAPYYPIAWLEHIYMKTAAGYYIWCVWTYLIFLCGAFSLFEAVRECQKSFKIAAFSFFLYFLTPVIFAAGHYNNKDMTYASLCMIAFLGGLKFVRSSGKKLTGRRLIWLVIFMIAAALATNVRVIGGWICAVMLAFYLFYGRNDKLWKRLIYIIGISVVTVGIYIIVTPSAFQNFIPFAKELLFSAKDFQRWNGNIYINGSVYTGKGHPWYYLPEYLFLTTPLIIDILILISMIYTGKCTVDLIKRKCDKDKKDELIPVLISLVIWAPLFVYASFSDMLYYNRWRQFTFVYPFLIFMSGFGIKRLYLSLIKKKSNISGKLKVSALIYVWVLVVIVAVGHPAQIAYINPVGIVNADQKYELDYWGITRKLALKKIIDRNEPVTVALTDENLAECLYLFPKEKQSLITFTDEVTYDEAKEAGADHVIVYVTEVEIASVLKSGKPIDPKDYILEGYHLCDRVTAYGNDLILIFERDEK